MPFTEMKLSFSSGEHAVLASPEACGTATTSSTLVAGTGASATPSSAYTVDANGEGGACPPDASVLAEVQRAAADDERGSVRHAHPRIRIAATTSRSSARSRPCCLPGLLGELAAVTLCAEPLAAQGACGAQSTIGTATVSVGDGASPLEAERQRLPDGAL